jgi:hypothetical protein
MNDEIPTEKEEKKELQQGACVRRVIEKMSENDIKKRGYARTSPKESNKPRKA